jgi:hypothetical protein
MQLLYEYPVKSYGKRFHAVKNKIIAIMFHVPPYICQKSKNGKHIFCLNRDYLLELFIKSLNYD